MNAAFIEALQNLLEYREKRKQAKPSKDVSFSLVEVDLAIVKLLDRFHHLYEVSPYLEEAYTHLQSLLNETLTPINIEDLDLHLTNLVSMYQIKNEQAHVVEVYELAKKFGKKLHNLSLVITASCGMAIASSNIPGRKGETLDELVKEFGEPSRETIEKILSHASKVKKDPIEQSEKYLSISDEVEKEVQRRIEIEGRMPRTPNQYWNIKTAVLKEHGIDWKNPGLMNPGKNFA